MFKKRIFEYICEKKIKNLSIIGMAKNAGKTVTFNNIVREAVAGDMILALLSYGRDGEKVDSVTRQEKPQIFVPPACVFATADKAYKKSSLKADLITKTGIKTLMGEVNIYKNSNRGDYVELVGINSGSKLREVIKMMPKGVDLKIIDGALDRKSSAVPSLTDGFILATGAVVANSEKSVIDKTLFTVNKLTISGIDSPYLKEYTEKLYKKNRGGILINDGELIPFNSTFGSLKVIEENTANSLQAVILSGALIDSFVEKIIYRLKLSNFKLIVRDGSRIFINKRNFNLLAKYNIDLKVFNPAQLIAVTVNPKSPYGISLAGSRLVKELRNKLGNIPVYDILSGEYGKLPLKGEV